jgi:hypothetical protein
LPNHTAGVMNKLLVLYITQRGFIFLDEWSFYYILYRLYRRGCPKWLISSVLMFGFFALVTSYKNLSILEGMLGVDQGWLFWPFFKGYKKIDLIKQDNFDSATKINTDIKDGEQ